MWPMDIMRWFDAMCRFVFTSYRRRTLKPNVWHKGGKAEIWHTLPLPCQTMLPFLHLPLPRSPREPHPYMWTSSDGGLRVPPSNNRRTLVSTLPDTVSVQEPSPSNVVPPRDTRHTVRYCHSDSLQSLSEKHQWWLQYHNNNRTRTSQRETVVWNKLVITLRNKSKVSTFLRPVYMSG